MRIWDTRLLGKLCQKHLCAMWREGLGCYNIVTSDKQGYRNHPATIEFLGHEGILWDVLKQTRDEMLRRGYNPREMPQYVCDSTLNDYVPWQTLDEQVELLKSKGCKCNV